MRIVHCHHTVQGNQLFTLFANTYTHGKQQTNHSENKKPRIVLSQF